MAPVENPPFPLVDTPWQVKHLSNGKASVDRFKRFEHEAGPVRRLVCHWTFLFALTGFSILNAERPIQKGSHANHIFFASLPLHLIACCSRRGSVCSSPDCRCLRRHWLHWSPFRQQLR